VNTLSTTLVFIGIFTFLIAAVCLLPRQWARFLPWMAFSGATLLAAGLSIALEQRGRLGAPVSEDEAPRAVTAERAPVDPERVIYSI